MLLQNQDPEVYAAIESEKTRQQDGLELIASENFVSKAVLEAAGAGLETVLKTTVFLTDMGEFAALNGVYAEFFSDTPPAQHRSGLRLAVRSPGRN